MTFVTNLPEVTKGNVKDRINIQRYRTPEEIMKTPKGTYYWFAIFVLCFITYQQVIDNIRPNYTGNNLMIKYLLGIAPNFFPAIGIPALFVILLPQMKQTNKWFIEYRYLTANLIPVTGLISWEFIQASSTKLRFDWNDVLWTITGAIVFQMIWALTPKTFKELNKEPGSEKGSR